MVPELRCRVSREYLFAVAASPLIAALVLPLFFRSCFGPNSMPISFVEMTVVIAALFVVQLLYRSAHEIRMSGEGQVQFKMLLRTITVDVRNLTLIRARSSDNNVWFETTTSKTMAMRRMSGLHALLTQIEALNPAVRIRGL